MKLDPVPVSQGLQESKLFTAIGKMVRYVCNMTDHLNFVSSPRLLVFSPQDLTRRNKLSTDHSFQPLSLPIKSRTFDATLGVLICRLLWKGQQLRHRPS